MHCYSKISVKLKKCSLNFTKKIHFKKCCVKKKVKKK